MIMLRHTQNALRWRAYPIALETIGGTSKRAKLLFMSQPMSAFSTQSRNVLPKLPVPLLRNTVLKFIRFARPLQNDIEYQRTLAIANGFMHSKEADILQNHLEDRAVKLNNWLTPWWIDKTYLEARTPLPIVTNPGVCFPKWDYSGIDGQIDAAAKVAQAALKFYLMIIRDELPQERVGDVYLDMKQYKYIFGTTRTPAFGKDKILYGNRHQPPPTHFVAMRNGHLFRVPAFDSNGNLLSIGQLKNELKNRVIAESSDLSRCPVGVVTSEHRDKWASLYSRLKDVNEDSVRCMEEALFVLCIDKKVEGIEGVSPLDIQSLQSLHGGGCANNSHNRWFDKTLQLIIGTDGYCGVNYEHTAIEGPPVAALMDFICDQFDNNSFETRDADGKIIPTSGVKFRLQNKDMDVIEEAKKNIDNMAADTDLLVYSFKHYGKDFIKQCGLSPDSYIQLAMQLAYYRIHHKQPPTYETATLRRFEEGRTDTIRLPSLESAMFTYEMVESEQEPSDTELVHMLKYAIEKHKHYTVQAMIGNGMDRHLLGLRLAAAELNMPSPEIFRTSAYQHMMHFTLSTSQVPTRHFITMAYGPSAPDCYAVCYNPQKNALHFSICTLKKCVDTSSSRFARELEHALTNMEELLKKAAVIYGSKL
uniref:Choline/carnitine acyltransferase domain-containing protein n=1 Tax=Parascaris univalens TaxID=6257 RepID=A0A915AHW4_PARUN